MEIVSNEDAVKRIRKIVEEEGSQAAAARRLKISPMYMSDILHGNRGVSPKLAERLGLERRIVFVKKD